MRPEEKMQKFTLKAAAAIVAALCGSAAMAADVQIYGVLDEGFAFTRTDLDNGSDATNVFDMKSGITKGSRFGFKGNEELGNGWKVGFVLENGLEVDTGAFATATGSRLFGREASLYIDHPDYGQLAMGRLQHLTAGYGTWGVAATILNPYAIGWSTHIVGYKNVFGFNSGRLDNTIAYKSPTFGGFTAYAQYSGNTNSYDDPDTKNAVENKGSADRYGSLGLKYAAGPFTSIVTVEWSAWSNKRAATQKADDGIAVTLGGNYKFDFGTLYLAGQYFDNQYKLASASEIVPLQGADGDRMVKGFGVIAGAKIPAGGGNIQMALGVRDAELVNNSDVKATRIAGSVGYVYPLSKRTNIYTSAAYTRDDMDKADGTNVNPNATQVVLGLCHSF